MEPFHLDEKEGYAVVTFPEFGDAMKTRAVEEQLHALVLTKRLVVFDLSKCVSLDTPWLRLITMLSKEATATGRRVRVAGASDAVRRSADFLGHRKYLHEVASVEEALKQDADEEAKRGETHDA